VRTGFLAHFGRDILSQVARDELTQRGVQADFFIDTSEASPGVAAVEIDANGERTVFYNLNGYRRISAADVPSDLGARTRLVLVDGYETEGALAVLEQARAAGIHSVLDLETGDPAMLRRLLALGTEAILPLAGAQHLSGKTAAADVLRELALLTSARLIVTDGARGSWALASDGVIHQPAFGIDAVDTTGCGDAYHGAYAYALLAGWSLPQRMEFAAYVASRVALNLGGRSALPTWETLRKEDHSRFSAGLRECLAAHM
jgi:sugar/nucleoside kinase (ribokinase family)